MDYENMLQSELEDLVIKKDGKAICELGKRYRYGEKGTEKNLTMAYRMYHKAEKMDMQEAYLALGQMYENGEYFGKNMQVAQEYYSKAGISSGAAVQSNINTQSIEPQLINNNFQSTAIRNDVDSITALPQSSTTTECHSTDIKNLLAQAEQNRQQENFQNVKQLIQQALREIATVSSTLERRELEIESYWILAYTGFNEQDYNVFQSYLSHDGVLEQHPWGNYLLTVVHRMLGVEDNILFQDMQNMLNSLNNPKLAEKELADILGMLGDLSMAGITNGGVEPTQQAYEFYNNAANLGNAYAEEQRSKFKKNLFGKMIYHG